MPHRLSGRRQVVASQGRFDSIRSACSSGQFRVRASCNGRDRTGLSRRRSRVRVPSLAFHRRPQLAAVAGETLNGRLSALRGSPHRSGACRNKNVAKKWRHFAVAPCIEAGGLGEDDRFRREANTLPPTAESAARMGRRHSGAVACFISGPVLQIAQSGSAAIANRARRGGYGALGGRGGVRG